MSIVSSTYSVGAAQACGRVDVTETHTDSEGGIHVSVYRIAPGADYTAIMQARAVAIAEQLAEAEAEALLGE
jgi:hypothetical protein